MKSTFLLSISALLMVTGTQAGPIISTPIPKISSSSIIPPIINPSIIGSPAAPIPSDIPIIASSIPGIIITEAPIKIAPRAIEEIITISPESIIIPSIKPAH
uniref:Uncharacterized protein n=1 Tax=Caenorhabditis japonica TaxID=281687 RepID=A0A8R1IPA8_CAEJA